MAGLALGAGVGVVDGVGAGVRNGITGTVLATVAAAVFTSNIWASSLAMAQLARRWRTPVRLMSFLDDARERNVLRTVGPVYQFRHARLQDRLAGPAESQQEPSSAPR
jgi:hypothetical protein